MLDILLDRLEAVRQTGPGQWRARCPAHGSKSLTLSIRETDDRTLLHCFAQCEPLDVLAAVGLRMQDLFPDRPVDHKPRRRYAMPASEALALTSHECAVAVLILHDVIRDRAFEDEQLARLVLAAERISDARNLAAPARAKADASA